MSPAAINPEMPESLVGPSMSSRFPDLRGVRWRINLGVLPSSLSSSIDDLRRVTADSRRRYAGLRKCLLIDPHVPDVGDDIPDLSIDNPLSQNPDSMWGRFFRNAELEQMVNKDLSRLYPEHESYFQTPGCQALLRRILLLWCLRHPECGYRQGMHELLAPLIYVLHADIQRFNEVRKLYEDHFVDKFDEILFHESRDFNFRISTRTLEDDDASQKRSRKHTSLSDLDANIQTIIFLNDPYGAEGELGIVLSEKFMEHDAYSMFDALMSGAGGTVAMAKFFSHSSASATQTGLAPVIEASLAVYHLLSIVDSSLYSHLVELGVEPQYFALRWLRVLFGREFSLEELLVIWDEIFSFENSQSAKAPESDPAVLNSPRGAFVSAMAVSMMLHLRSSLLATEHATTCLQRLLNFPENVDLGKLIEKAKSLVSLALDSSVPFHSTPVIGDDNLSKRGGEKGHRHSLSLDSSSTGTPGVSPVPERYWEEKWRVLYEEEETKKGSSSEKGSSQKRGWTEKIKLRLSRKRSDSSSSISRDRDHNSSTRRSLCEDLSQKLNFSEDTEEAAHDKSSTIVQGSMSHNIDKRFSGPSSSNEEPSPASSEPASFVEHDSEKSTMTLNLSPDLIEGGTKNSSSSQSTMEESPLPISDPPDMEAYGGFDTYNDSSEPIVTVSKEQRTTSGRFPWFWKFGRQSYGEGTSDRRPEAEDEKYLDGESFQRDKVGISAEDTNRNPPNLKTDCDQNLLCTLRNLGHSMLENIQVIESAFQQERSQAGSLEHLSKHALVGKGQVTAMTALKELRKISNLLREM